MRSSTATLNFAKILAGILSKAAPCYLCSTDTAVYVYNEFIMVDRGLITENLTNISTRDFFWFIQVHVHTG